MPVVYSDPLHEDLMIIIEAVANNLDENEMMKEKLQRLHARMKNAPVWRPGQYYANPPVRAEVKPKARN